MVEINEKSFAIRVETNTPIDDWLQLVDQMLDLLASENDDMHENRFLIIALIRDMLPRDIQDIKSLYHFTAELEERKKAMLEPK